MNPTQHSFHPPRPRGVVRLGGALVLALAACSPLHALTVTLGANNGFGTSSFNTSLSWSDGAAPAAGNAYVVPSGLTLRTPADSTVDHVFAGDSLTLTGATLNYKGGTNVNTITINNLVLDGATVNNAANTPTAFILGGSIAVAGTGTSTLFSNNASITVTAPISGNSGTLLLQTNNVLGRQVILSGASTYTGTINVTGASGAVLDAAGSLAFAIGASGVNNTIGGTGPFIFDGTFNIDLSGAGTTVGDSWTLVNVDTLAETFGATFSIAGFTENENIWTSASGTYQFIEATGVLSRISTDSDGDGLPDAWEYANFGSGNLSESATGDYDLDFASNLFEYQNGTNPANPASYPDTDSDGLNDGWENLYFNNLTQTADGDPDGDFNSNAAEYTAETDPAFAGSYPDTEDGFGDGLNDGWEIHYFGSIAAGIPAADPDGDLVSNLDEFTAGTDPTEQLSSPDSDGDGLADGWEVFHFGESGESLEVIVAKQAAAGDPDADGYNNLIERSAGTDPNDGASFPSSLAYWRFEEKTSGEVPYDGTGGNVPDTVLDSSGVGNHMRTWLWWSAPTYTTGVPFSPVPVTGAINTASLEFNGALNAAGANINDSVYLPATSILGSYDFDAMTIEASFNTQQPGNWQTFVGKDGYPNTGNSEGQSPVAFKLNNNNTIEASIVDGAGFRKRVFTTRAVAANTWYSAVMTVSADTLSLWVKWPENSSYVVEGSVAISGALYQSTGVWTVGRGMWANAQTDMFRGSIDEVRISHKVLAPSEFLVPVTGNDTDGDGMDDTWETASFGGLGETGAGDFDGDGTTNLVEFLIGLDPTDGSSVFAGTLDGYTLTWPAAAGLTFTVERSTTLGVWEEVGTVNATSTTATWTDSSPLSGKAFYRVVLDTD
jgi:hypothetical protein